MMCCGTPSLIPKGNLDIVSLLVKAFWGQMCFGCAEMDLEVGERARFYSVTELSVESLDAQGLGAVVLVGTVDVKQENRGLLPLHPLPLLSPHPNLFYVLCFCVRFPLEKVIHVV